MISSKWVYSWKVNEFGRAVRAKARLVTRCFGQRAGVEFFEIFSPCPSVASTGLLAAIASELGLDLSHFDAEQAFVQPKLSDVYMRLPIGCGAMSGKVVKLCRSLYGLKQASRQRHHRLLRCMRGLGFKQCQADACVLRLEEAGAVSIVVVVHVDDKFAMGLKSRCDKFCEDLNPFVPINNLGELRWCAGCRFSRDWDAGTLTVS